MIASPAQFYVLAARFEGLRRPCPTKIQGETFDRICPNCHGTGWVPLPEAERVGALLEVKDELGHEVQERQRQDGETRTLGWRATCKCNAGDPVPAVVLDPFCGVGATLLAATRLGRRSIGVDLSAEYLELARQRLSAGIQIRGLD